MRLSTVAFFTNCRRSTLTLKPDIGSLSRTLRKTQSSKTSRNSFRQFSKFFFRPPASGLRPPASYYLAVGRLLHYKRFDLVIRAFAKLGLPLRIVGSGPDEIKLRLLAHKLNASNIRFWPHATDNDLQNLYNGANALIFPQVEDFGLVAAEAQMCGCPVIAYRAGGALEIIKDKKTGVFFDAQTPEAIITAVNHFEKNTWDRKKIAESAQRFSKENFKISLAKMIEKTCG